MTHLRDMLRGADPLRHEPDRLAERLAAIRRDVVEAGHGAGRSDTTGPRGRMWAAFAAVVLIVSVLSGGAQLWIRGGATLHAAMRFEVRLAEVSAAPGLQAVTVEQTGRVVHLHPDVIVTNADIADTRIQEDAASRFGVVVEFTAPAARRLRAVTTAHVGRPMAILIDGAVVAAPVVRSAWAETATLSGDFTRAEAERIAEGIRLR